MLPGNSGTCWLEGSAFRARGLLVGDGGPKASVWPECGVGVGRPEHARQARTTVGLMRYWRRFSASFCENSKAAIAKWNEDMKNRGLVAGWVKSRSIFGVDLQRHVNWADEDHFEQCLVSAPLVPRATHLAAAKELATRWNTGVDDLDRDLLGVQMSRIVDASFHSVNLVPCPAPVTVGDLPPGLVSVDDFHAETFQDSRIGPWRPGHIDRYAPDGAPGLDAWDGTLFVLWTCILRPCFVSSLIAWIFLISPSFCCRPGWLAFPRMMGRLTGVRSLS